MSYDLSLSEDAIVSIFSWLPAKLVLRFSSVSKSIYACIRSPSFIRLQTLRSPKRLIFIHRFGDKEEDSKCIYTMHPENQLSYNPGIPSVECPFRMFRIVGSCNGILCIVEHISVRVHLWNPSIRRIVTIHELPNLTVHGFGFDPTIDDYKIVTISQPWLSSVYTVKTRRLREIASPTTTFSHVNSHQCLFNGSLHWIAGGYLTGGVWHEYLLTFDLCLEVFSTIELPVPSYEARVVTIIKGCLGVISWKHDGITIWVRREYTNDTAASWSVAYKLDSNSLKDEAYKVSQTTPNDVSIRVYKGILVYNPETRIAMRLANVSDSSCIFDMRMCDESVALLDMGSSHEKSKSQGKKRSRTSEILEH